MKEYTIKIPVEIIKTTSRLVNFGGPTIIESDDGVEIAKAWSTSGGYRVYLNGHNDVAVIIHCDNPIAELIENIAKELEGER